MIAVRVDENEVRSGIMGARRGNGMSRRSGLAVGAVLMVLAAGLASVSQGAKR